MPVLRVDSDSDSVQEIVGSSTSNTTTTTVTQRVLAAPGIMTRSRLERIRTGIQQPVIPTSISTIHVTPAASSVTPVSTLALAVTTVTSALPPMVACTSRASPSFVHSRLSVNNPNPYGITTADPVPSLRTRIQENLRHNNALRRPVHFNAYPAVVQICGGSKCTLSARDFFSHHFVDEHLAERTQHLQNINVLPLGTPERTKSHEAIFSNDPSVKIPAWHDIQGPELPYP